MGFLHPHVGHRRGDGEAAVIRFSSCPALCRASTSSSFEVQDVDGRDIGERSDAVLQTAVPGHDAGSTSHMKKFRTLDDVDVKGKRVLLRVDLNVPMEGG